MNPNKLLQFVSRLNPCSRGALCLCHRNIVQNLLFIPITKTEENRQWQELRKLDKSYRLCYGWQMQGKKPYKEGKKKDGVSYTYFIP